MPYTIPSSTISPGSVYQPKKGGLILDQITGAIAAWSTRRLISSAPADIARGRDASTNELDFTAAELTGSGFTDLAGAGDGFYVTLYDQIGSNNATQSTAASQPKGVDTGTLITDGVNPIPLYDGLNNFLQSADNIAFDWSTDLTIMCKAKSYLTSPTPATSDYLFGKYDYGTNQREIALGVDVNNKVELVIGSNSGATANEWNSTSPITINQYNHYCLSYSGTAIKVFVNGSEINGSFVVGSLPSTLVNGSADFVIGSILNNGNSVLHWNGEINDVIIFNRALSASEVAQLHTALA